MTSQEIAKNEGILIGLKIAKEIFAQGTISHNELRENEIYYTEVLANGLKELQDKKQQEVFSEEQNRKKYGEPENDLIAQWFAFNIDFGCLFCLVHIQTYARRYNSDAEKGHNEADIKKMLDFCNRAISYTQSQGEDFYFILFIELKKLIDNNENCLEYCNEIRNEIFKFLQV